MFSKETCIESEESAVDWMKLDPVTIHISRELAKAVQIFGTTMNCEPGPFYTGLIQTCYGFIIDCKCQKLIHILLFLWIYAHAITPFLHGSNTINLNYSLSTE